MRSINNWKSPEPSTNPMYDYDEYEPVTEDPIITDFDSGNTDYGSFTFYIWKCGNCGESNEREFSERFKLFSKRHNEELDKDQCEHCGEEPSEGWSDCI